MKETLDLIKKYGATAVLVLWLWHTHNRVEKLEAKLYDCLQAKKISALKKDMQLAAILPKKIKYETD